MIRHAFDPVVDAVIEATQYEPPYGMPTELERYCKTVVSMALNIDQVRMVNSGTEVRSAVRLARIYWRDKINVCWLLSQRFLNPGGGGNL
jgi:glutamate-1-semialdehyde 2,1-aminomutase